MIKQKQYATEKYLTQITLVSEESGEQTIFESILTFSEPQKGDEFTVHTSEEYVLHQKITGIDREGLRIVTKPITLQDEAIQEFREYTGRSRHI